MSLASLAPHRGAGLAPRHRGDARAPRQALQALQARASRPTSYGVLGTARFLGRVVGWVVLASVVAVFVFLAVGPHVMGYRTATMLTGSMEPMIAPGDVVVSVPRPVTEVAVGDVISYHIPVEDHRVETHRVVSVDRDAQGRPVVETKGDANPNKDPWTATLDGDVVWETRAVVPHLGTAVRALRDPHIQTFGFWGGLAGLLVLGLATIWRGDRTGDADTDPDTDADTAGDEVAVRPHGEPSGSTIDPTPTSAGVGAEGGRSDV